ncbi:MAG: L-seryl-tRNA(Sec) selenium transferase [Verrucomicrobia bacterium]|nr:L-seryl-tRNA(Sec) selenium transferase [Verrucomicrobiota bacterium]MBU4247386.1 L-seryl-tRNA(Sec) selenium transferase [Verrucomicrobiota bacterium]MBU4292114.1 L-seryl-tRNA(Sec) selenium transferase [Verrucomicrobiota bacterium]MBU4498191.1 L-seryl-tRNA(Sec) selenium transferase [Verrucomicrobiota bacterium]MCG2681391.1 L-seryl-tRNA(Sec) selenium transferase [Kiritimatiellia bacterium]
MKKDICKLARDLPAVDAVLTLPEAAKLIAGHGREMVLESVRTVLDERRTAILKGESPKPCECNAFMILERAAKDIERAILPRLNRVVNATGIILHTGLGRAVMPEAARAALSHVTGYCNLQQNLQTGQRDRREDCMRELVQELTGAEDVLVVNNNAGATFLLLTALARGREVVISRGELIEIGGSFRLPDIMQASGAILHEIGTTNKTHLKDYEGAVSAQTALILKAHKSNFKIVGFTKEVDIADIAKVGSKHGVPVVDDLGCGALVGLERFGLDHEYTVRESLEAGADLALFSTDKLIGGPQGGMIVGRAELIERIRSHPLYRVLRVCKLTLGALEATLRLFKAPDLLAKKHPLYTMIIRTPAEMQAQASELKKGLALKMPDWELAVSEEVSYLGGGTMPESGMPSFAVRIKAPATRSDQLALQFRMADVPIVARVAEDRVILDMRTVFPTDIPDILEAVEHSVPGDSGQ